MGEGMRKRHQSGHILQRGAAGFGLRPNCTVSIRFSVADAARSALRPLVEEMERRLLLSAYTLNTVATFGTNATGADPQCTLIADASGNLYGTAASAGAYAGGTVFKVASGSGKITALASFNGADGASPAGTMAMDASGDLYGTTTAGGDFGLGTVFEIAGGSNAVTTLASFNGDDGAYGYGGVTLDAAGNLYGTTEQGGASNDGTAFELPRGSGTITTLAVFSGINGANPYCPLTLDSGGNLYGTAENGGANNAGTVFEIATGSNRITTLASFSPLPLGLARNSPVGGLTLDSSGNVYGAIPEPAGEPFSPGALFEIARGSNTITTLVSFSGDIFGPDSPVVLDASGDIFDKLSNRVIELPAGSTQATTIASFGQTNAWPPLGGLTEDAAGDLFGTNAGGGSNGTVFEIAAGTNAITTLAVFAESGLGYPADGLAMDASGNLYGAASHIDEGVSGAVFELAPGSNVLTTLASVPGVQGPLAVDAAGDVYGTMGTTVFEIAAGTNTERALAAFKGAGEVNQGVILDASGDIYGTTEMNVYGGGGTLFEIANGSNAFTTLTSFGAGVPQPPGLVLDASGDLYGTIYNGGTGGDGTAFELPKGSDTITTLATFGGTLGSSPEQLTIDSSGDLYGATDTGGVGGYGTVFEIPNGSAAVTVLASFNNTNGTEPYGVAVDASGNVYGRTRFGGPLNDGTVFEISKGSNTATTLAAFNGSNGADPVGLITPDGLGNFYGTTEFGGVGGAGIVFELTANTTVILTPIGGPNPSNAGQPLDFTATVTGGVPEGETMSLLDTSNNNAVVASGTIYNGSATLTVPAGALMPGTHKLIAAYAGDGNFAACQSAPVVQTVNSDPLPSYIIPSANAAYGYNSVTGALNLTSGTLTFTADNTVAPLVNLTASGPASGVFFDTSEHLAGLALSGGAQATVLSLGPARTHSNHNVLVIGTPGAANNPTFSIDSQSKLDLLDNDLILHTGSSDAGGASEYAAVAALAADGRNPASGAPGQPDGQWNGNGLSSSAAASADASAGYEKIGLAVVDNNALVAGGFSSWQVGSFNEALGLNDIIVKYDYLGDYALEGQVSADDAGILQIEYDNGATTGHTWATGSSLDDGLSDSTEAGLFQLQFGLGTGGINGDQL